MKNFLKKLFGKKEEVEQPEMEATVEETPSTETENPSENEKQSEERMM